jgi:uncharacterized protein (TIGR03435 family)
MGAEVVDKTGLTGKYDFTLKFNPKMMQRWQRDDADTWPTLITALPDQLGLKLEAVKGPVEMLVIEHIEKPSPN